MTKNTYQQIMWQFIRNDLPNKEFERWLYTNSDFENYAEKDFYLEVISTNFESKDEVYLLKKKLEEFLRTQLPLDCECITLSDIAITDMGSRKEKNVFNTLKEVTRYGESRWWIGLYQCTKFVQYWLIAQETRQNDIHCYKRLEKIEAAKILQNDEWPRYFTTLEELFYIGKNSGRSWRFVDPLNSSLVYSVEDLRKERPDISAAEIASLLNIDENLITEICKKNS